MAFFICLLLGVLCMVILAMMRRDRDKETAMWRKHRIFIKRLRVLHGQHRVRFSRVATDIHSDILNLYAAIFDVKD